MLLSELSASAERVALVGLAKNTGKTVALAALLRELAAAGRTVGVTSVGRDGEEHDVIDFRIDKPAVELSGGSIVASTDSLLRASGVPMKTLERTGVRTPLGEVLIARLTGPGKIEVAGPSAAADVRRVADAMLRFGARQVLIDGAIDRRAASSPDVADALVMSTGAVLSEDIEEVIEITREAVELVRLPVIDRRTVVGERLHALAASAEGQSSALIGEDGEPVALPARFVLTADSAQIGAALAGAPQARLLLVGGALPDRFLRELLAVRRRVGGEMTVVVGDATKVFLADRGLDWYRRQGVEIAALHPIALCALTVNPVAPRSHDFDSAVLRARLEETIPDLPIFDVMHPEYAGDQGRRPT